MSAHRTKPATCIVRGCGLPADRPGAARGFCILHYSAWRRHGVCQALVNVCERPAISHIGMCDLHDPRAVRR